MPPNLEEYYNETNIDTTEVPNIQLILTPLSMSPVLNSDPDITEEDLETYEYEDNFQVPLEYNLRELLVKVSNTEDLDSVTQLKLRVIAREVALQQLGVHTPSLRTLILDGSYISSLRELGSGLKNLTSLHVNHCSLTCIDSVFGFEKLQELYASDNFIRDLLPCAFLSNLKVLDVRRNCLSKTNTISYLTLCGNLESIFLEGNNEIEALPNYRESVKKILPSLQILDGVDFAENNNDRTPRTRQTTQFVVNFPPRVFVNRPLVHTNGHIFMRGDQIIPSTDLQLQNLEE